MAGSSGDKDILWGLLTFDAYCEKTLFQLQMELIDLQCSEDFKSKIPVGDIFDFNKKHVLQSVRFPISQTQQVAIVFGTRYYKGKLFSKIKHAKNMILSKLSNHHLSNGLLLYSHEQLYIHIYICMQNHNDDTIKSSDTDL